MGELEEDAEDEGRGNPLAYFPWFCLRSRSNGSSSTSSDSEAVSSRKNKADDGDGYAGHYDDEDGEDGEGATTLCKAWRIGDVRTQNLCVYRSK